MIINCTGCGVSVSSKKEMCPYCKKNNFESIQMLTGKVRKNEKEEWREKMKGTILAFVTR